MTDDQGTKRIRMPIEDRIPPEQWVVEEPASQPSDANAAAEWEAAVRRRNLQEGTGG
jgi:hypothetical protein